MMGEEKRESHISLERAFDLMGPPTHFSDKTTVQIGLAECQHRSWDN